ncbi:MAG: amylo-alpha-1,6-glucosidase, partial [Candidatus Eiseniibacteriota bacterium]
MTSSVGGGTSAAISLEGPGLAIDRREWLETDGLGGFASGTVSLARTRRYHALLLSAQQPPLARRALVQGFEAWLTTPRGRFALSSQRYAPGVTHPDGASRIRSFALDPWPRWVFECEDGTRLSLEIFSRFGVPVTALSWRVLSAEHAAEGPLMLEFRPLLSVRDPHTLHHENAGFDFSAVVEECAEPTGEHAPASAHAAGNGKGDGRSNGSAIAAPPGTRVSWRPYAGEPQILALANGRYEQQPEWYRHFVYEAESARGLDDREDLASPGIFRFDLAGRDAACLLAAATEETRELLAAPDPEALLVKLRGNEKRRRRFTDRLERAADWFIVKRGRGKSLIAGYPWFGEWGRDTFIALRGLCLATGRMDDARRILILWSASLQDGLMPNRFPDGGEPPEYNSVDAPLWFVVAANEFLEAGRERDKTVGAADRLKLRGAVAAVLEAYLRGTSYGIRVDGDGLLAAGTRGSNLTWMDARVNGRAVTPRVGKPVEVQALWINALLIGASISARWADAARRAREAFERRFWNEERDCLYDVVDVNHVAGQADASLRPNQLLAVGGLPFASLKGEHARRVVETCERELWTPLGCRTLAPGEPGYAPRYGGAPAERDAAYHQGTVWPWLAGPFIEAWVRVRGGTAEARRQARERFFAPLLAQLDLAGLGSLPEVADAEPPHLAGGCPFQAWSASELLRLDRLVLGGGAAATRATRVVSVRTR